MEKQEQFPLFYNQIKDLIAYYGADFLVANWHKKEVKSFTGEVITLENVQAVIAYDSVSASKQEREEALKRKEVLQTEHDFPEVFEDLFNHDECPFIPEDNSIISSK